MKSKIIAAAIGIVCLMVHPIMAQDESPTSKPNAIAPYKTAVGIRLSSYHMYGSDLSVSAKHFIRPEKALELQVGTTSRHHHASLQFIWQPQLLTSPRLRPYAGIGLGLTGTEFNRYGEKQPMETNLVGLASFGIEYTFPKAPMTLSLDYRHAFVGYKHDYEKDVPINRLNNLGFGLKYSFK
jgi:hypothetical protein